MAISTNKNPIIICKGKRITTLAELQENFDISKVCAYARSGRLSQWLISIGEEAVNDEIQGIDFSLPEAMLVEDLMVVLELSDAQQERVFNELNSKSSAPPSSEGSAPGTESCMKTNDTPQKLLPVLRKVMAKKEFVMQTVQDVLKNDCDPDEIKWNTNLSLQVGMRSEQRDEIYDRLKLYGWQEGTIQYAYPLAMFLQVIRRDFPGRYGHIDVYNLHNFENALKALGDDAAALGFIE